MQQEEQLYSCRSSVREVKSVDKPSQTWTGKNPKRGKNLKIGEKIEFLASLNLNFRSYHLNGSMKINILTELTELNPLQLSVCSYLIWFSRYLNFAPKLVLI